MRSRLLEAQTMLILLTMRRSDLKTKIRSRVFSAAIKAALCVDFTKFEKIRVNRV